LFWLNYRLRREVSYPIISLVHHLRSSEPHPALLKSVYRAVERLYLNSVDGFVFNSHTTRRVVSGLLRRRRPHLVAQPGGDRLRSRLRPGELQRRSRQPGPLRVLFVGSLIRRKAPHVLLAALRQLPTGYAVATFAGAKADMTYAAELRKQAGGLPVIFAGHLNDAQLAAAMRRSHILVLPSEYEGYGIAYLEGMGFGLPAIGTQAGAARELISHGQNGYLIPPGDAGALANHLRRLQRDRRSLLRLSQAARKRYEQHPTWQSSMARIERFLSTYNEKHPLTSLEEK
jgi:glycosyltransferase involved in cell wall biosynthesis